MSDQLREAALHYHRAKPPGKLAMVATKPLANQRDLALAYSPGVAAACERIVDDPGEAAALTARGNLVAVVSNGTAVLGLGAIGPLAAKPVMEGKAVLFKQFAGIDAFDIEIDERDPDKLVEIVAALEPTFGAINLEDIKAPECFEVEARLRERMRIPVFHDDQHGTAIIVAAAVLNGLHLLGKRIEEVRLTACGAGAAALACLDLLTTLGLRQENLLVVDIEGVVYAGRTELMDPYKARYARDTEKRTLAEAIEGADIFLGLSAPRLVTQAMVQTMAERPLILALANPVPEIEPEDARAARPDAIIATGRSDYPNQVNNVLCFPFIFRGALDVGATTINDQMKIACAHAIAAVARTTAPDTVAAAYGGSSVFYGPECIIPKPFDSRLAVELPIAVARAAMASGVATRPIEDLNAYRERLSQFVFRSGLTMKPIFERARARPMRVAFADGEEERVLRAVEVLLDERLAQPILIGRPDVVRSRIERLGLQFSAERDVELCNPESDPRYHDYVSHYLARMSRRGVTPEAARELVRTRTTVIGAIMVDRGEADALITGPTGRFQSHVRHIQDVLGLRPDAQELLDRPSRDPGARCAVHGRHLRERRPAGGRDRRDDAAGGRHRAPVRHRAQGGAALAFQLRQPGDRERGQDAPGARADPGAGAGARGGRRDARRCGAVRGNPGAHPAGLAAQRRGQSPDLPQPRCRQHRVQSAQGRDQLGLSRPDPGRTGQAGARPDAIGHHARHRQLIGARRRGRAGCAWMIRP